MIELLGLFIGIHLTILSLSAAYRIIDLWYVITQHLARILVRIVMVTLLTGLVYLFGNHVLSESRFTNAVVYGQLGMLILHVSLFYLGKLAVWRLGKKSTSRNWEIDH